MNWIFYVFTPVLVHLVISELTVILADNVLDSAARTALSAFLTLPFVLWMYWQDKKRNTSPVNMRYMDTITPKESHRLAGPLKGSTRQGMKSLAAAGICLAGGGLLNVLWSSILNLLQITSYFSNETQAALLTSRILMQLLGPGLLVPVTEELVFRGLFYARIRSRLQAVQAVFISALFFALYHGNPIQMIYAFPMALILAALYERSGRLTYPVLFHMGANLAAILLPLI